MAPVPERRHSDRMQLAAFTNHSVPLFQTPPNQTQTKGEIMTRHLLIKLLFVGCAFAVPPGLAPAANADIPSMNVTVFDALGGVAFKGPINANASFATQNLHPGNYVVQFNTRSAAVKGNQYLLVVSAGKKKVIAAAVPGETFNGGGAAMKVQVGPGSNITGQVVNDQAVARVDGLKFRVIDGKRFVWVTEELGSNRGGHWAEEGLPPAQNVVAWRTADIQKRQDRGGEGSMITYKDSYWLKGY
jgi:hypothetical protein